MIKQSIKALLILGPLVLMLTLAYLVESFWWTFLYVLTGVSISSMMFHLLYFKNPF